MSDDFQVLITADEAWPAFENAVLNARSEIVAGFRIFDMRTKLRSDAARAIGDDWFDLLAHVVSKGVSFRLMVSDFDSTMATPLHELSWTTVRQGAALSELVGDGGGEVEVTAELHPARAGALPWMMFLPAVLRRKNMTYAELSPDRRTRQAIRLRKDRLPRMHTVTHHQKVAVIDGEVLYIGGLDLNERRWDNLDHDLPAVETWSDVQLLMRGPEAAEARAHLDSFVASCAGDTPPPKLRHIKRTLSSPRPVQFPFLSPKSVLTEIESAHLDAAKSARHFIHIETQFFRSSTIADGFAEAAARNRDLHMIVILPALPESLAVYSEDGLDTRYGIALQKDALDTLQEGFKDRLLLTTPVRNVFAARDTKQTLCGSPTIHVHNKVLLKDDDYALIGSANLNGRSLRWDTEAAVEITQDTRIAETRNRLLHHWWFDPLPEEAMSVETLFQWWQNKITENGLKRPENRAGFLVPHDPENHASLAQPLPGMTEDMV